LVGLVDWDEAFVGPAEIGLANAAWEWGHGLWADDVYEFVELYLAAGGIASSPSEVELRQLLRARLRWEVRYSLLDNPDPDYEARQLRVYERLRICSDRSASRSELLAGRREDACDTCDHLIPDPSPPEPRSPPSGGR
jgi:hypothetical protein